MARHHYIHSAEPVHDRITLAACGKRVERLQQIGTDVDLKDLDFSSLTRCKKCLASKGERYLYVGKESWNVAALDSEAV